MPVPLPPAPYNTKKGGGSAPFGRDGAPPHSLFSIIIADRGDPQSVSKPCNCRTFAWFGLGSGLVRRPAVWNRCVKTMQLSNICLVRAWFALGSGPPCCVKTMQLSNICLVRAWFGPAVLCQRENMQKVTKVVAKIDFGSLDVGPKGR